MKKSVDRWLKRLQHFGTKMPADEVRRDHYELTMAILDRHEPIDALSALISAIEPDPNTCPLAQTAIGIDANVLLRLASHRNSAAIIDYLGTNHDAPIIIPGQAIHEFWNNQLSAVNTVAKSISTKLSELKFEVGKLGNEYSDSVTKLEDNIDEIEDDIKLVYDQKTVKLTVKFLKTLEQKATVSFVPRQRFLPVCEQRKKTKTPPGFNDVGDGDFYIWADFLSGLIQKQNSGANYKKSVFVTLDKKSDWSRDATAHPILAAEARAATGVPFEIWNLDRLSKEVDVAT